MGFLIMRPKISNLYYGWYITGIAFTAYFLSTGTGFYAFNAILEPLCRLRGWSRTDVNLALVIGTMFSFICQYFYGTLLIRMGGRILMAIGALVAGAAFICIPRAQQLWQFYLFYGVLFMGNGAYGSIVASSIVNNWFISKRGKALGLATAGMSVSGAVVPFFVWVLIHFVGLVQAAFIVGLMIMFFAPVAWLFIRDWPEEMGWGPDGIKQGEIQACLGESKDDRFEISPNSPLEKNFKEIILDAVFWKIGISFALLMIGTVGVMSQLKPRFTDMGYSGLTAMGMMGATALIGAVGKYVWARLCDRFETRYVAVTMAIANAAGLGLLFFQNAALALAAFIVLYGFSMGGTMSVYPVMIATTYGRKNFTRVFKTGSVFLSLQLLGYLIAGMSFDFLGSYDAAYLIFIILDMIAALLLAAAARHV